VTGDHPGPDRIVERNLGVREGGSVRLGIAAIRRQHLEGVEEIGLEARSGHFQFSLDHLFGEAVHRDAKTAGHQRQGLMCLRILKAKGERTAGFHVGSIGAVTSQVNSDGTRLRMERTASG